MTIDLGFAWTTCRPAPVAFVDVPGHERFVTTMLAGVGPVPAVLLVVAADEGWMPQSAEHVDALDALGVRHGLLVVTRSDLLEPELARDEARERARRHLAGRDRGRGRVSAATGDGHGRAAGRARRCSSRGCPRPTTRADVRLWVDRAFTIRGAGTVVTGTLRGGPAPGGRRAGAATADRPRAGSRCGGCRASAPTAAVAGCRGSRSTCAACRATRSPRRRAAQAGRLAADSTLDVRLVRLHGGHRTLSSCPRS